MRANVLAHLRIILPGSVVGRDRTPKPKLDPAPLGFVKQTHSVAHEMPPLPSYDGAYSNQAQWVVHRERRSPSNKGLLKEPVSATLRDDTHHWTLHLKAVMPSHIGRQQHREQPSPATGPTIQSLSPRPVVIREHDGPAQPGR